ncbi:glyoxalase [Nitratireductor sp. CAU 1489]|uniref:Glyoxalase n=1 Tax=Nitratireductor arenosus TaxID=2682096 RepID=A0A844QFC0_9HYPH|nr:VOC family protein [Nitratireductor arenosus]MVA97294.1 glyoxalase [Nitratireductor arenosus]
MQTFTAIEAPRIFPAMRFRDASRMIDWLCEAFGFTVHAKYMDGATVVHAQLAFGSSMIMCGDMRDSAYGDLVGAPDGAGGKSLYIAVDDVDALCARAAKAGAEIVEGPVERDYGSREIVCRDPEGNIWAFGTYWPKAHEPAE